MLRKFFAKIICKRTTVLLYNKPNSKNSIKKCWRIVLKLRKEQFTAQNKKNYGKHKTMGE